MDLRRLAITRFRTWPDPVERFQVHFVLHIGALGGVRRLQIHVSQHPVGAHAVLVAAHLHIEGRHIGPAVQRQLRLEVIVALNEIRCPSAARLAAAHIPSILNNFGNVGEKGQLGRIHLAGNDLAQKALVHRDQVGFPVHGQAGHFIPLAAAQPFHQVGIQLLERGLIPAALLGTVFVRFCSLASMVWRVCCSLLAVLRT